LSGLQRNSNWTWKHGFLSWGGHFLQTENYIGDKHCESGTNRGKNLNATNSPFWKELCGCLFDEKKKLKLIKSSVCIAHKNSSKSLPKFEFFSKVNRMHCIQMNLAEGPSKKLI